MGAELLDAFQTPAELTKQVAKQAAQRRKRHKLTQKELSERAGMSLSSYKRFEQTGEIAFASLVRVAYALACEEDVRGLFAGVEYQSIQEVIDERNHKP